LALFKKEMTKKSLLFRKITLLCTLFSIESLHKKISPWVLFGGADFFFAVPGAG
jgi:hypothetical protein